jgi:hypothetical protein
MTLKVDLTFEQIAQAIEQMTPGELETLAILLDPDLRRELHERRNILEQAEGKLLQEEELFME